MPDEKPEDHLNIWEILMKKRLGESPKDYVNLYDELTKKKHHKEEKPSDYKDAFNDMKEKLDNKTSGSDYLVGITTDSINIGAMKVSYSRENLDKILDFINDISDGEAKL